MRFIKAFLVGATGLFIFITLLSLLIPANPRVSRTVIINSSKEKILKQINNWKNWQPLFASDAAKVEFGKTSEGGDAKCSIEYNGKITNLRIMKADSSSVTISLTGDGENDITSQIFLSSLNPSQQTRVDWIATTHLHWYPWEKFYAIFIDKLTGPGYEASLNGLKSFVESH
ncbi:MAG: hypothetical protein V4685_00445 [Bacteroidota bacterium]